MKTILVLNTGSSSVKASLLYPESEINGNEPNRIVTAHGERLGTHDSFLRISISITAANSILKNQQNIENPGNKKFKRSDSLQLTSRATERQKSHAINKEPSDVNTEPVIETFAINEPDMSHRQAIILFIEKVKARIPGLMETVAAVGHRVVHGGDKFSEASLVTEEVLDAIQNVSHLAPLHNPSNLEGIRIAKAVFPEHVPNVAVFDTAFHSTMPAFAYTYPLPKEYAHHQIRKYGFHGTSVKYVTQAATRTLERLNKGHRNLIVAHLGNGASVTAVVDGKGVDTSMEFTPLSGIMMGTRSGSVDPSIILYASQQMNKTPEEVLNDLNKKSGLYGVSGGHNDMRVIIERASNCDPDALLALEMFVYILAKYIAGLVVSCGGYIDALIFTAGIGEHSPLIRKLTIEKLSGILGGMTVDVERNEHNGSYSDGVISEDSQSCVAMVIPTDEEAMICRECEAFI
jgi:acetate kinase